MTVCSGIGAPEIAAPFIDWRYQSEIEPFACAVLKKRFPGAINLGNMENFKDWPQYAINILCGGTPCQSFSIAGLGKGLADPRGNLALVYLALLSRYSPEWSVWENVPNLLSINGGRDFGTFLGAMAKLGYGFAYRILDTQFVRVESWPRAIPHRRRRLLVVGYRGDWRRAASILFERESLSGHSPPSRKARKAFADGTWPSTQSYSWPADVAPTLGTNWADRHPGTQNQDFLSQAGGMFVPDVANCMTRRMSKGVNTTMDEGQTMIATEKGVRRLIPRECARLQGFPDDHCEIEFKGKPATDSHQYRAYGNTMSANVMNWVLTRIHERELSYAGISNSK